MPAIVSFLSAEQLQELREDIDSLSLAIQALLHDTEVGTKPVILRENIGRLSRMDEMHNQSILKANRTLLTNRLKKLLKAAQRCEEGSYGRCLDCDELIAFPRLKAYPDAEFCIECQAFNEQHYSDR